MRKGRTLPCIIFRNGCTYCRSLETNAMYERHFFFTKIASACYVRHDGIAHHSFDSVWTFQLEFNQKMRFLGDFAEVRSFGGVPF